ncbi:MFS transporter [Dactylosporangium sp. NPDC051485]|uniref:MFS transporter n=1 Tax=Dactylosporangium sp. NPDC051485 TaxID=3154846 RepID=UPI0034348888
MSFTSSRDVFTLAVARGVSLLGDFMATTALVLALQERGASGTVVAALFAAAVLPQVVLVPLAGRLVDRADSRALLTVTGLAQAACCAAMAFVDSTWLLVGLVALLGAGLTITMPTFSALLPEMAGPAGVGRAMAIGQTANSLGSLAGPALAGVLVGAFGLRVPLLVDAATYLAVAGAGLLLRTRRRGEREVASRGTPEWRIRDDRLLVSSLALLGAIVLALNVFVVVGVFYLRGVLGASPAEYGLVDAAWMLGLLLGGWLGALRPRPDGPTARLLAAAFLATALAVLAAGLVTRLWMVYPLWLLGGLMNGVDNTLLGVLAVRRVPAAVRGAYFARLGAVVNAANLVGFAAGGALVDQFAPRAIVIGCGLTGLLAAVIFGVPLVSASSAADSSRTGRSSPRSPSPASSRSAP